MTTSETSVKRLARADGVELAYRFAEGDGPAIVFLPGYMSDMEGGKATAVFEKAQSEGRACLLLDYSGCGESGGDFADGTLDVWRDDALLLINSIIGEKPVILVGSSMGGWLMLLIAAKLGSRVAGLVGIAAAPDFTEWGYDEEQKASLARGETIYEENAYGPDPTPTHACFWKSGQGNLMLQKPIAIDCPVRLLQGQRDADVLWRTALDLAAALQGDDVRTTLIKDGDHRLSRDSDIALLLDAVFGL